MKYSAVVVALLGAAVAQDLSMIPECAQKCITDAVSSSTNCKADDFPCICKNQNALIGGATPCVIEKCGADVATGKVLPATQKFCEEVAAGGGSSASASASASAPASSAPESSAPASSAPSSSAAETESATASASETVGPTGYPTGTSAPTGASNGTATATGAQPTSTVEIAGAAAAGSIGGLAMLLLGAVAAL